MAFEKSETETGRPHLPKSPGILKSIEVIYNSYRAKGEEIFHASHLYFFVISSLVALKLLRFWLETRRVLLRHLHSQQSRLTVRRRPLQATMMTSIIFYKICIEFLPRLSKQRRRGRRGRGLGGRVESVRAVREPLVPKSTPAPYGYCAPPLCRGRGPLFPCLHRVCLPAHLRGRQLRYRCLLRPKRRQRWIWKREDVVLKKKGLMQKKNGPV